MGPASVGLSRRDESGRSLIPSPIPTLTSPPPAPALGLGLVWPWSLLAGSPLPHRVLPGPWPYLPSQGPISGTVHGAYGATALRCKVRYICQKKKFPQSPIPSPPRPASCTAVLCVCVVLCTGEMLGFLASSWGSTCSTASGRRTDTRLSQELGLAAGKVTLTDSAWSLLWGCWCWLSHTERPARIPVG